MLGDPSLVEKVTVQEVTLAEVAKQSPNARCWARDSGKEAQPKTTGSVEVGSKSQELIGQGQDSRVSIAIQPAVFRVAQGRVLRPERQVPGLNPVVSPAEQTLLTLVTKHMAYGGDLFLCS